MTGGGGPGPHKSPRTPRLESLPEKHLPIEMDQLSHHKAQHQNFCSLIKNSRSPIAFQYLSLPFIHHTSKPLTQWRRKSTRLKVQTGAKPSLIFRIYPERAETTQEPHRHRVPKSPRELIGSAAVTKESLWCQSSFSLRRVARASACSGPAWPGAPTQPDWSARR